MTDNVIELPTQPQRYYRVVIDDPSDGSFEPIRLRFEATERGCGGVATATCLEETERTGRDLRIVAIHHATAYVNAYEVTLAYGGPQEGGWWYDVETPLASVPVSTADAARACEMAIRQAIEPTFEGRPGKSSTHPLAGDLVIRIEDAYAEAGPKQTPRYE